MITVLLAAAGCLTGPTSQTSQTRFSQAEMSLVPPEPLQLGGYTERQNKLFVRGGDDLKARVILFPQEKIAVVSLEMLTIPESLHDEIQKRNPDLKLFINATHTHCAPDSQMLNRRMTFAIPGIATFREKWLTWYADRAAATIQQAKSQKPTLIKSLELAQFRVPFNRGRRRLAQPSTLATAIFANGKLLFFNFAAHPVNYDSDELKLRSDWPGRWMKEMGGIAFGGALGDVSPSFGPGTPEERIDRFGEATSDLLLNAKRTPLEPKITFSSTLIKGLQPKPHPQFAKSNGIPDVLAESLIKKFAPTEVRLTSLRIGKTLLVGISGEPTAELGQKLELDAKNRGYSAPLLISHVNGWAGYMLGSEDYNRGGYEAQLSFYGPEAGEQFVTQARQTY